MVDKNLSCFSGPVKQDCKYVVVLLLIFSMSDSDSEVQFKQVRTETTAEEEQPMTIRPNYTVVDDSHDEPDGTNRAAMDVSRDYDTPERDDPPVHSTPVAASGDGEDIRIVKRREAPREYDIPQRSANDRGRGDYSDGGRGRDLSPLAGGRERQARLNKDRPRASYMASSDEEYAFERRSLINYRRGITRPREGSSEDEVDRRPRDIARRQTSHRQYNPNDDRENERRRYGPSRHLAVRPDDYEGSKDWDEYFSHFNNCAELGRWSTTDRALTLASCLKGAARTFYLGLKESDRSSFTRLVDKLRNRFGSDRQQSLYLAKFESRKRQPNETIAIFGDDLRLLAKRAYPKLDQLAQESIAVNQFYKSISLEMKCRCIDRDCCTIGEAVNVVERYETILGEDKKRSGNVRATYNQKQKEEYSTDTAEQIQEVLKRMERMEAQMLQQRGYRYSRNNRGCFRCGAFDHFIKDCRQTEQTMATKRTQSGNYNPLA